MNRRTRWLAVAGATVAAASSADAQTITSPYEYLERTQSVHLYGGYLETDGGELGLGPKGGSLVGALYSIRFTGPLAGEVDLAFSPSARDVYVREDPDSEALTLRGEESSALLLVEVGLRFQITGPRTWYNLAPYLGVGGGLISELGGTKDLEEDLPEEQHFDFGPAFAGRASLGADYFLSERLSIRAAGHFHLWRTTIPEGLSPLGREENEWVPAFGGTVGAAYHF